ncbi:hypothetical protein H4Q26_007032 [Puccinia striiformis f. sp. tritici PST-130]|uniref:Uncharacterized protein n=2 Tax=Puccinia striiformis TaxID=27350 RepID=A0A0L0W3G4_9BASI|nr:hypothetical protein H4Q26_007032 [Puccinia striiformis f. sp. tritici PST-130]KNF05992.1 hypothetical protein PSTG_00984 [Puccinia striiformis f. sp. tritici PST-78]POW12592.1 hypothetical protein PSTT_04312 [Puccinia striiformis]
MASSLPFILLCLQLVSIVFSSSDLSGHVYRRSPAKTPKPAPGTAAPNGNPPNPKTTGKPAPFGFGSKVTSGGNATPQTPKDAAQLEAWLTDKVPRVILISKTYDFTSLTNTTASGWYLNFNLIQPWKACSNGLHVQSAVNYDNWCSKEKTLSNVPSLTGITTLAALTQKLFRTATRPKGVLTADQKRVERIELIKRMVTPNGHQRDRTALGHRETGRDIFEWARKQYYQHFSPSDSRLSPPARLMAKLSATQRTAATQVETAFALHL